MVKNKKKFFAKLILLIISVFTLLIILLSFFLPNYIKEYIETNDKEWINREVNIKEIEINPLTFSFNIQGIQITEPNSEVLFASLNNLYVNLELLPLFQSTIDIEEIVLDQFSCQIIQNNGVFNFSDLFKPETNKESESSSGINFDIRNIEIKESSIHYIDAFLENNIVLDSIFISDNSFTSNDTVFDVKLAIHQPNGGDIEGDVYFNLITSDYKLNTQIDTWQLISYKDYVTSFIELKEFAGELNADLKISGNTTSDYIGCVGQVSVNDFKIVDPENKSLLRFGEFFIDVNQIDSRTNSYDFKDVLLDSTYVNFEYLENSDNFSKWLVTDSLASDSLNVMSKSYVSPFEMLSVYIYDMTKEYIFKSYSAERILVSNLNLKFYDYTLDDPFHMDMTNLEIKSENLKPKNQFADFTINGNLNTTGELIGEISVSREGVENMTVDLSVKDLVLDRLSPYGRFYTAHNFKEGVMNFHNKSVIKESYLTSNNEFFIESIKIGDKRKTRSGYSLPMKLVIALVKDIDGNVRLEIPIEGPIKDPEYKFGKAIRQVVKTLFSKIVKSPTKALSNALKLDENDLKSVYFDNGQIGLSPLQKNSLDKIANLLNKKEEFNIELVHLYDVEYEMDAIALKSAKLKYLKQSNLVLDENIPLGKQAFDLSSSEPDFLTYLKTNTVSFDEKSSTPENARRLLGTDVVKNELNMIMAKQKSLIKNYFINEKGIALHRFKIIDSSDSGAGLNQTKPKFDINFSVD